MWNKRQLLRDCFLGAPQNFKTFREDGRSMDHTMKAFDKELDLIKQQIAIMGALALDMTSRAVELLARGSGEKAAEVIACDHRIDELQRAVEDKIIVTIARRQPEADDLRHLVGALRIVGYLERIGDYAKKIAERLTIMSDLTPSPQALLMAKPLGTAAQHQLRDVLSAYDEDDPQKAEAVWRADAELDAMEEAAFSHVLTFMVENAQTISYCSHVIFCYKHLERIGDHVTNIAESVVYMTTGQSLAHRPKGRSSRT
jgi:phosphate transport system protein